MTRVVRDRILKEANGDISGHLHNHIHLTNCIHLKNHNHMHKHSPVLADRSIMRELVVLQRSRSLRDPSASPPSWHSHSVVDVLSKRGERDAIANNGRLSVDIENQRDGRRILGSSPLVASLWRAEVAFGEVSGRNDGAIAVSDRNSKSGIRERRRVKSDVSSQRNLGFDLKGGNDDPPQNDSGLIHDIVSGNSEPKDKKMKQKGRHVEDGFLKTLSEQLNKVRADGDEVASSHIHTQGKNIQNEQMGEEAEAGIRGHCSGLNRVKRRKFRGTRRPRTLKASRDAGVKNEMSVASNSLGQRSARPKYPMEEGEEEYGAQNVTRAPRNGCGIPWNWSRIHHRGKSFLDMAGRSLYCGLSDSKSKRAGQDPREEDASDMPVMSDHLSSSSKCDAEVLPLLAEASGSLETTDNAAWVHDYSGELGIFADNLLKQDIDSDLASEARSRYQHKFRRHHNGRHQNLTQKYMPKTFRDLVGQNLVAQALSNAVVRRKVGLLYVFYGPHGTGKTSCARIFARALNCQSLEQPKPCGFCNSCIAYDMDKSRNIREVGPVSNVDFESIMDLLDNMIVSHLPSQCRVFIFDDCDTLSPDCWIAISKFIDRAPRRVIFVLVSSSLDVLPHIIISRCQKFFFPKLKDADIIYALQWIATNEDLEIDKDALKLIASKSDGSLRDAEMTLEQLSLLGQRISVPLVQELVGLISDEKLVELLDLALSADTVNTVKNLREVMESGVEPLALMSQLATVITDILAGTYDLAKERPRRKFFRRQALSKEQMEKLRQALKTLSEAEKQLRVSNDRLTWLTAALLQLAPDQQYMLPSSSADTSFNHSPLAQSNAGGRERPRKSNVERAEMPTTERESLQAGSSGGVYHNAKVKGNTTDRRIRAASAMVPPQTLTRSADLNNISGRPLSDRVRKEIEEIWLEVLEKIQISTIKEFMYQEGKLIAVSFGAAPTVQLMFSSQLTKSKAEKCRAYILQAFESVMGSPLTIEIRCELQKDARTGVNMPLVLPGSQDCLSKVYTNAGLMSSNRMATVANNDISKRVLKERDGLTQAQVLQPDSLGLGTSEIVEISSPRNPKDNEHETNSAQCERRDVSTMASLPERRKLGEQNRNLSLVRSKVSLAHVIQHAEGCSQRNGWSKRKAVSIAEKLEQENLKLEPRSRSLLCWKASRVTRRKISRLKVKARRPETLLRFVSCCKYLSAKSPT
ncbi:Protein STICHEL-like [Actinidia chinensis var. chinensis]|uniref:Protein STICHEL-like n=1 Tax=Actinidia chinensis var. chinensis TaxID=1590841 RepID=A0A2R6PY48_ACTCC|nr:Protein STICHEL-like [Actinidia chinensis var. chinensis]